jgi:AcrR family transcriptional regulator
MHERDSEILNAAFALIRDSGWSRLDLRDIARRANMTLAELYGHVTNKHELLCLFSRHVNEAVLHVAAFDTDANETPRERLFEVLMARFDVLAPFKSGLKKIAGDLPRDPAAAILIAAMLPSSMGWMMEAAGVALTGPLAPARVLILTGLYARVLRVWLDDDSEDNGKAMAELDRLLKKAEGWAKSFGSND